MRLTFPASPTTSTLTKSQSQGPLLYDLRNALEWLTRLVAVPPGQSPLAYGLTNTD